MVCADSACTVRGLIEHAPQYEKIRVVDVEGGTLVFGCCGDLDYFDWMVSWWLAGAQASEFVQVQSSVAETAMSVFFADEVWSYDLSCPHKSRLPYPFAMGSGTHIAKGALHAGAGAHRAVEVACLLDPHSGLPVHGVPISTLRSTDYHPANPKPRRSTRHRSRR